ncbi:hypothetical protein SUDANB95_07869 (plasmid) [Actinosynnema sp. ALI-1.44]
MSDKSIATTGQPRASVAGPNPEPPSPTSTTRRAKLINRVRYLRAKAKSSTFTDESEAFGARAAALMRKHGITESELKNADTEGRRLPVTGTEARQLPITASESDDFDEDDFDEDAVCRSEDCDEDPRGGEGWDGYCGNCADRIFAEEEDDEFEADDHHDEAAEQTGDTRVPADERRARPGRKWWRKMMRRLVPKRWWKAIRRNRRRPMCPSTDLHDLFAGLSTHLRAAEAIEELADRYAIPVSLWTARTPFVAWELPHGVELTEEQWRRVGRTSEMMVFATMVDDEQANRGSHIDVRLALLQAGVLCRGRVDEPDHVCHTVLTDEVARTLGRCPSCRPADVADALAAGCPGAPDVENYTVHFPDDSGRGCERCGLPLPEDYHLTVAAERAAGTSSPDERTRAAAPATALSGTPMLALPPATSADQESAADQRTDDRPRSYSGLIEWDLELYDSPRAAAEAMWRYVRDSTGPVVELFDGNGTRWTVDLEREPGDDDVTVTPTA